jgi:hypothetical protein
MHLKSRAEAGRRRGAVRRPTVGGRLKTMVHVDSQRGRCAGAGGALTRHMQQHGGIEPAAETDGETELVAAKSGRFTRGVERRA